MNVEDNVRIPPTAGVGDDVGDDADGGEPHFCAPVGAAKASNTATRRTLSAVRRTRKRSWGTGIEGKNARKMPGRSPTVQQSPQAISLVALAFAYFDVVISGCGYTGSK